MKERRPRIPAELAERIDEARGMVPFEPWVRQALEDALEATAAVAEARRVTVERIPPDSERVVWPENRGAASPQVSAHVRPAIPKKG